MLSTKGGMMVRRKKATGELRVLVAEDSFFWQRVIGEALEKTGLSSVIVSDGVLAFDQLEVAMNLDRPFHALITDNAMIKMDGAELIRKILKQTQFSGMKIAMASGGSCPNIIIGNKIPFVTKRQDDPHGTADKIMSLVMLWQNEGLGM